MEELGHMFFHHSSLIIAILSLIFELDEMFMNVF